MSSILAWFGAPRLAHPELRRRARALWIVSWPLFAVVAVILGIAVAVEPATLARRAMTVSAVGILMAILHSISRGGRPVLASWILVLGLTIIVTQRAWITGGIHAPVAVFYTLFIVIAGVLIGTRGSVATAALALGGAILLTVGTSQGWLTPRPGAGSPAGGFVFVLLAIGLAMVLQALMAFRPRREGPAVDAVQMIVHDMKSPMHVVLAHLELLREDIRGESAADVEGAINGARTLHRMTNSLLDASRLEEGRMPVERARTDLSALARSVTDALRVIQPDRDLGLESRGDVHCDCDPELTRRVLENLVTNAMKHTPVSGRIRVRAVGARDTVQLHVQDEGPGVPPDRRARIFEAYSARALRSSSGLESSGLGLAFCKLAVEAQGGEIRLEDAPSGGALFVVELPRH